MSKALITESILDDIAVAIKNKGNIQGTIKPANMAQQILNLPSETHDPVSVDITQSANQTISTTYSINFGTAKTSSFVINLPTSVTVNATIAASVGYDAGELNQESATAQWGDTVSFSATPAEKAKVRLTIVQPFGGTISVNNEVGNYFELDAGIPITITTETDSGFEFYGWEGV